MADSEKVTRVVSGRASLEAGHAARELALTLFPGGAEVVSVEPVKGDEGDEAQGALRQWTATFEPA